MADARSGSRPQPSGGVVETLRAEVVSLTEQNRRLEHLLDELRRAIRGRKSEKLHPDRLQLALEELEGALAETEEETPAGTARPARPKRPAKPDARTDLRTATGVT